ncbi:MAG: PKD domain-containing protein [Sandaracinaceae bacterium]|nr:PKD domain-containing protein [Sandaracinaceae bacterium]
MRRNTSLLLGFLLLLPACGSRTTLKVGTDGSVPPVPDGGGFDAGFDGGLDAGSDGGFDAGPPEELIADCGRRNQYTSPRRPITVMGTATSSDEIVDEGWTLVDQPRTSMPAFGPAGPGEATLTPDVEGDYLLRYDVADAAGRVATCEVVVHSVIGPPVAICPEEPLTTTIDVPLAVLGDGYDDDMVVSYQWELALEPRRSGARVRPTDEPVTEFVTPTRGDYVLRLTVVDLDMATDSCEVMITVTGPPEVMCPDSPIMAPTRQRVNVTATATDDVGIASETWELVSSPRGSTATARAMNPTRLTPDRQGSYLLRFTATDVEGLSASCEVEVIGTPTPPTLTCPMLVTTEPLRPVDITATAEDDGMITGWRWTVSDRPPGSAAAEPTPRTSPTTTFTPDLAGVYEVTVEVTDDDGMMASCTTTVEAGNVDGLRVEMAWDTARTDMDLHLLNPTGTMWTSSDDCHYRNCTPRMMSLEWGGPGTADNPRLDIDDTDGFGPENINIESPEPGIYRIGVHNFAGAGPNNTTVSIYCGGSTTTPRQTFGPVPLRGGSDDLWRVADVEITARGCTITDLTRPDGRANISPLRTTQGMR